MGAGDWGMDDSMMQIKNYSKCSWLNFMSEEKTWFQQNISEIGNIDVSPLQSDMKFMLNHWI